MELTQGQISEIISNYLPLWYQQQPQLISDDDLFSDDDLYSCDLLENIYLCGINNNCPADGYVSETVVICLKISTFVVSTTTLFIKSTASMRCDLLENIYLCGINNNRPRYWLISARVVICLKISTFVVSTTTA